MADFQIGENLYADPTGKYYRLNNGAKAYEASPYDEMTNKLNSLYDNQRKTQIEQLRTERDRAVKGYNQQKTQLKPKYQNQRNQADVVNAQNVSRLRELMAAQGINASGENLTTQASMASARQGAFNEINQAENQVMGDIDRQIAEVNDPSREQAIYNAVEAERSKAITDSYGQWQQDLYKRQQDYQTYRMQQEQMKWQRQMEEAQLALQRQAAARAATKAPSQPKAQKVEKKSNGQSYADGLAYWNSQIDNIKKQGAVRVEKALRSDPVQIAQLEGQGYNIESVIDALYNAASGGRFENQTSYKKYMDTLTKDAY